MSSVQLVPTLCVIALVLRIPVQADDCSQLLKDGIFDTRSSLNVQDRARSYANWFCSMNFSEASQADSFGAELAFPFKGIPIKFGFNSSNQSFSQWYSSFCQDVRETFSEHILVEDHVRTASKDVLDAFTKCTTTDGFHVWLEYSPNVQQIRKFTLAATFRTPNSDRIPSATISTFEAPGVRCIPSPKGVQVKRPTQRFVCTRPGTDEVRIALSSKDYDPGGAGDLVLPAIPKIGVASRDEPLVVNAQSVPIDFTPQDGPRRSGCSCGSSEVVFPGPHDVGVNQEFSFRYDAANVCYKQGFDKFFGVVLWGPSYTTVSNTNGGSYPGIAGTVKAKFSKPGDHNVFVHLTVDCLDNGCRNTCRAEGTTQIHIK